MNYCPHCRRGLTTSHLVSAMVLGSIILGTFAGISIQLPAEGAALGALHAVVPVAWVMEEAA